jgi:hypothetical protein
MTDVDNNMILNENLFYPFIPLFPHIGITRPANHHLHFQSKAPVRPCCNIRIRQQILNWSAEDYGWESRNSEAENGSSL